MNIPCSRRFNWRFTAVFGAFCVLLLVITYMLTRKPNCKMHFLPNANKVNSRYGVERKFEAFDESIHVNLNATSKRRLLYKEILSGNHTFNNIDVMSFKTELQSELEKNFSQLLFVSQQNSPIGTKLKYYLNSWEKVYTVSTDIHNYLPKGQISKQIKRCSVVGNSGNLLDSKCGHHIDSADFVYRCNAAPLKSFGNDAGVKSDVTSLNPSALMTRYNQLFESEDIVRFLEDMRQYTGYIWGPCYSTSTYINLCIKALKNYNIAENVFVMGHPYHYEQVTEFWRKRGVLRRPSTGFYFVSDALVRCSEVHLYGFWPFPHVPNPDAYSVHKVSYHYFEEMAFPDSNNAHCMNEEFAVLLQLHFRGIIKLHVGECAY